MGRFFSATLLTSILIACPVFLRAQEPVKPDPAVKPHEPVKPPHPVGPKPGEKPFPGPGDHPEGPPKVPPGEELRKLRGVHLEGTTTPPDDTKQEPDSNATRQDKHADKDAKQDKDDNDAGPCEEYDWVARVYKPCVKHPSGEGKPHPKQSDVCASFGAKGTKEYNKCVHDLVAPCNPRSLDCTK